MDNHVSSLVDLARQTVNAYARNQEVFSPSPDSLPEFQAKRAGVFVSIYTKDKSLRGCIGTIQATQPNVITETVTNAISASNRDPRFSPVTPDELDNLVYSVSILHEPEQVFRLEDLDVHKYGVIVVADHKRGLLLPNIESITSVEEQVGHAMYKGGIQFGETISLFRFQVDEYKEPQG